MNLFLEMLRRLRRLMLPIDLNKRAGFICVTTLENKLDDKLSSWSPSRKERFSGRMLRLLADRSSVFNYFITYRLTRLLGLILLNDRFNVSRR